MIYRSALDRFSKRAKIHSDGKAVYAPANLAAAIGKLPVVEYNGSITPASGSPLPGDAVHGHPAEPVPAE